VSEPVDADPARDPGLAAERTSIAVGRSGLAIVACAAVVLRRASTSSRFVNALVSAILLATVAASTLVLWRRRATLTEAASVSRTARQLRDMAMLSSLVGVVCLAVVGLGLVE
jgi:hypothetical protein